MVKFDFERGRTNRHSGAAHRRRVLAASTTLFVVCLAHGAHAQTAGSLSGIDDPYGARSAGLKTMVNAPDGASPQAGSAQPDETNRPFQLAQAPDGSSATVQPGQLTQSQPQPQSQMGGAESATEELDLTLGQHQVYGDLRSLQQSIIDMQRPTTNIEARQSTQSDHVDISQVELSQDLFFEEGRDRLRLGVQSVLFAPQTGPDVAMRALGLNGSYRINDWSAITGDAWANAVESGKLPSYVTATYDVFLTLWPNDFIRIDLDTNRKTFDNITSLQESITGRSVGGSIDFNPSDSLRLTFRASGSFYSDSNQEQSAEIEGMTRILNHPMIQIGLRASGFQFSQQLNNGYFNPKNYISGEGVFRLQAPLSRNLDLEFEGSGGLEQADPGGSKPVVRSSLQLSYKALKNWTLDGGISYFSSREANSSGFARTSVSIGVHRKLN